MQMFHESSTTAIRLKTPPPLANAFYPVNRDASFNPVRYLIDELTILSTSGSSLKIREDSNGSGPRDVSPCVVVSFFFFLFTRKWKKHWLSRHAFRQCARFYRWWCIDVSTAPFVFRSRNFTFVLVYSQLFVYNLYINVVRCILRLTLSNVLLHKVLDIFYK